MKEQPITSKHCIENKTTKYRVGNTGLAWEWQKRGGVNQFNGIPHPF